MTNSVDRGVLQQFLLSDAAPRDSMCICELDGFLNGIAAGPKAIPSSEWSLIIWGSGIPSYQSAEQRELIANLLAKRYADIANLLEGSSEDTASIDAEDCDDRIVMASAWANGFLQAIELRMDAWRPLFQDRTLGMFLLPLASLSRESAEDYELPFSLDLNRAMVAVAAALLPTCARRIRQFWRNRAETHSTRFLKRVDGTWPHDSAPEMMIRPFTAHVLNATGSHAVASPADSVQPHSLQNVVNSSGRQPSEPTQFCDKLSAALREETVLREEATLLTDQTFVVALQEVPEDDGGPELAEAMMITDRSGRILSVNEAFTRITGYSCAEVVGQTPRILKSALVSQAEHVSFWQELVSKGCWHGHVWNRSRSGEPFLIRQTVTLVKDANDEPFGYLSVFKKILRSHVVTAEAQRVNAEL